MYKLGALTMVPVTTVRQGGKCYPCFTSEETVPERLGCLFEVIQLLSGIVQAFRGWRPCHIHTSCRCSPEGGQPQGVEGPGSHSPPPGEKGDHSGVGAPELLLKDKGDATHPGPLGRGEETATCSSGCGKVTGEKAAIVRAGVGAGSLSPRTLLCPGPRPAQGALSWGWGWGELALSLAPTAHVVQRGPPGEGIGLG